MSGQVGWQYLHQPLPHSVSISCDHREGWGGAQMEWGREGVTTPQRSTCKPHWLPCHSKEHRAFFRTQSIQAPKLFSPADFPPLRTKRKRIDEALTSSPPEEGQSVEDRRKGRGKAGSGPIHWVIHLCFKLGLMVEGICLEEGLFQRKRRWRACALYSEYIRNYENALSEVLASSRHAG